MEGDFCACVGEAEHDGGGAEGFVDVLGESVKREGEARE